LATEDGKSAAGASQAKMLAKADGLSTRSGVYLFKDRRGKVIYVGKAKNLRQRVRSYLRGGDGRFQIDFLMKRAVDLETLVTANETEALILENNLIKQYKPRYNIKLQDDKSYVSVKVTTKDDWPRIIVTRKIKKDGNTYLGPFASAVGVRETVGVIRKVFPLRTCSDAVFKNRSRPCLEYQIARCMGPCVYDVDRERYGAHLRGAMQLLEGRSETVVGDLTAEMKEASEEQRFEDAARVRDRIAAIGKMAEQQKVVDHGGGDRDIFGLYREGGYIEAQVLVVRGGKLVGNHDYRFEDHELPDAEVLSSLLARFYQAERFVPEEVLLPFAIEDADVLEVYLSGTRSRAVRVLVPRRGERRRLVEMALDNAAHAFAERSDEAIRRLKMLEELQYRLALTNMPKRIECFDISHSQGDCVVASLVAFDEGLPDKAGYRRYKLRGVQRNDDFAAMREVLSRRLARGIKQGGLPDLIVVDGGKGQLAMAVEAVNELGVEGVALAALAKDKVVADAAGAKLRRTEERVYRPGRANPIVLRRNSNALFLLQQLRDEAHRFAITFHRSLRSKNRIRSALDDIPGIGPAKRRALLERFGSVSGLAAAEPAAVAEVRGITLEAANRILAHLRGQSPISD